ncbi:unnamed protein product [Heligmosomoides polygyrus]|uniref:Uncharacterized protein n=1 Tax=Heligmosomoides polygyrus TaxID=6339 RepID=A0A183G6T8_HELPZ|nr:unnamed protein product [Heligmosomoides polygyrus]
MPSITTCKANLTKAFTALEVAKGKIPAPLLTAIDPCQHNQPHLFDARLKAIQSAMADLQSAIRTVKERRQIFLNTVGSSADPEADNAAYETYMHETRVDDAVVEAESILTTLQSSLDEVQLLIERHRLSQPSEVTQATNIDTEASPSHATITSHTSPHPSQTAPQSPLSTQQQQLDTTIPLSHCANNTLAPVNNPFTQVQFTPNIAPVHKFLYLQSLLTGEAQMVLQDLGPEEHNYYELVRVLKKRYDRPHKTRATLHKQLQQIPLSRNTGSDLRNTWFRISGILHSLRKYEDFRTVLPLLDLVKSKFPPDIRQKLHDLEYQSMTDFDLDQVMQKLDCH